MEKRKRVTKLHNTLKQRRQANNEDRQPLQTRKDVLMDSSQFKTKKRNEMHQSLQKQKQQQANNEQNDDEQNDRVQAGHSDPSRTSAHGFDSLDKSSSERFNQRQQQRTNNEQQNLEQQQLCKTQPTKICPNKYGWLNVIGMAGYLCAFAPGLGPIPWTYNAEIYPTEVASTGMYLCTLL